MTATQAAGAGTISLPKPLLRGWLHLVCFFLAIPAAALVIALATTPRARIGAIVYAVGLVALFGVSGAYHRGHWSPSWRQRMQRLDHATIFVMIAGSYTPLCLLVMRPWMAAVMLAIAWSGAALGAYLAYQNDNRSRIMRSALYIILGWTVAAATPQLIHRLSTAEMILIAVGGLLFTVGAITLATRWPDPFPRVLGYHEVWHLFVVAAVVCQFVALASVIHATPSS